MWGYGFRVTVVEKKEADPVTGQPLLVGSVLRVVFRKRCFYLLYFR
jgi:hypothetical protein